MSHDHPIRVHNPDKLPDAPIDVERVALGTAGDYKPCVAKLPNGELLLSAYRTVPALHGTPWADYHDWNEGNELQRRYLETTLLFRSTDGGRSWSPPRMTNTAGKEADAYAGTYSGLHLKVARWRVPGLPG